MKNIVAIFMGGAACALALQSYAGPDSAAVTADPSPTPSVADIPVACAASRTPSTAATGAPEVAPFGTFGVVASSASGYKVYGPYYSTNTNDGNTAFPQGTGAAHGTAGADVLVTEVVTSFTTFCPEATQLAFNDKTYTVTASAFLTVTHCPGGCHVTRPLRAITAATVTALVSSYTTYHSTPTVVAAHDSTYTITSPTVLTITGCPGGCTITTPVAALATLLPTGSAAGTIAANQGSAASNAGVATLHSGLNPGSPTAQATTIPAAPATGGASHLRGGALYAPVLFGIFLF